MKILKKTIVLALIVLMSTNCFSQSRVSVKQQLDAAVKEGNTVLMVVGDKQHSPTDLKAIAQSATAGQKSVKIIEMDKGDKANAALVDQYRIGSVPLPILLVFSDKGLFLGGMNQQQATEKAIVEAIPTPKYSEILWSLSEGKPVIAVVSNSKFESDKSAKELSESVVERINSGATLVSIDSEESAEAKLITMFNVKRKLKDSYIVAINAQGMMTGRFEKLPTEDELLEAVTKVVHTGCSPGGCGPSCH